MTMTAILYEAWATILARPWRFVLAVLAFAVLMIASALPEALAVGRAQQDYDANVRDGGSVIIVKAKDGTLDALSCLALGRASSVHAAGAIYGIGTTQISHSAGTSYRIASVSPQFPEVVDPAVRPTTGLIVGADLQKETSVRNGSALVFNDGREGIVDGTLTESGRTSTMGRWIMATVSVQSQAEECWIDAKPESLDMLRRAMPSLFPDENELELSSSIRPTFDSVVQQLKERPTAWSWVLGALLAFAASSFLLWTRRHELALYLVTGFSRSSVIAISVIELSLTAFLAIVISTLGSHAGCALLRLQTDLSISAVHINILLMACTTLIGGSAASALTLPRDAARTVRARD